jgi:hypothetical protein
MYLIFPAALWPWGPLSLLIEMNTRNLLGAKGRPACRADNITTICEPNDYTKCGNLDVSQFYGPSWPITRRALPFFFFTLHDSDYKLRHKHLPYPYYLSVSHHLVLSPTSQIISVGDTESLDKPTTNKKQTLSAELIQSILPDGPLLLLLPYFIFA